MKDIGASDKDLFNEGKLDKELIHKAIEFSKNKPKGQLRDEGTPYFEHVERVAKNLESIKETSDNIIVGYLHDILEDTETTFDELKEYFGEYIANSVKVLSKDKSDLNYSLENYLSKIADNKNIGLTIIKLLDRIDNIESLKVCPRVDKVKRYINETENIFLPTFEKGLYSNNKTVSMLINELKDKIVGLKTTL